MKILRRGDDFIKVPDADKNDLVKINSLLENGWNYSPKKDYKEAKGKSSVVETKAEKKEAKETKMRESKKEDQQKKQYREKKESKNKKDNKKDNKKGKK